MPFNFSYWQQVVSGLFINRKAICLDGINQEVDFGTIPVNDPLTLSSGDWTVGVWAKANGNHSGFARIFEKSTAGYANGWGIFVNSDNSNAYMWSNGSGLSTSISAINPLRYNHYAMVYDSTAGTLSAYINGSRYSTGSEPQPANVAANLYVGNWGGGGSSHYNGKVDQPVVFNKALTEEELRELITLRDVSQHSAYGNVIFWAEFEDDDISGTTVTPKVGGYTGTLINGAANCPCISYPYPYQLETDDYTPLQNSDGGWAWDLQGINGYVELPETGTLGFSDGVTGQDFSVATWVKYNPGTSNKFTAGQPAASSGTTTYWEMYIQGSIVKFKMRDTSGTTIATNTVFPNDNLEGNWKSVVFTYNNTTKRITAFFDGVQIATAVNASFGVMPAPTVPLRLGSTRAFGNLSGQMGQTFFVNKELSLAETQEIFNKHQDANYTDYSFSADILSHYNPKYSSIGTGTILDSVGTNHGTTVNMTEPDIIYDFPRTTFDLANDNEGCVGYDTNLEYIEVPTTNDFNFSNGTSDQPFTIISRFKVSSAKNYIAFAVVAQQWHFGIGAGNQLELERRDGTLNYIYRRNRTAGLPSSIDDTWAHAVVSFDGTNVTMYLNAEELANTETENLTYVTMADKGQTLEMNGKLLTGTVSRAWKQSHLTVLKGYALNQCQVQEIYNEGSPTDPTQWTFIDDVPTKFHWELNQNDDLTTSNGVVDIFNGHNGTGINLVAGDLETDDYPTN